MSWQDQMRELWANMALATIFITSAGKWACRVTYAAGVGSHSFAFSAGTVEEAVRLAYARWETDTGVVA